MAGRTPGSPPDPFEDPFADPEPVPDGWDFLSDDLGEREVVPPEPARSHTRTWTVVLLVVLVTAVMAVIGYVVATGRDAEAPTGSPAAPPSPTSPPSPTQSAPSASSPPPVPAVPTETALSALGTLPVKGRAPSTTGYDRDAFGTAWDDVDRNGCDTRNDILARDLDQIVFRPGTNHCLVERGTLADPYSGRPISFDRGWDTSIDVQIDHVVALSNSWQTGVAVLEAGKAPPIRQRPAQSPGRRRAAQHAEERRRRGHLAPAEQEVSLHLRRPAGRREGEVRALGDAAREGRDHPHPDGLPVRAGAGWLRC